MSDVEAWDGNNFVYFHPTGAELERPLAATVAWLTQLSALSDEVQSEHGAMMSDVEGQIERALSVAPNEPALLELQVRQDAAFAVAALKLLGEWIDLANYARRPWSDQTYEGFPSVDRLNEMYRTARDNDFGVGPDADNDLHREARSQAIAELSVLWAELDHIVDAKAVGIAAMIDQGATDDGLRILFRSGVIGEGHLVDYFPSFPPSNLTQQDWEDRVIFGIESTGLFGPTSTIPEHSAATLLSDPDIMNAVRAHLAGGADAGRQDGQTYDAADMPERNSGAELLSSYAIYADAPGRPSLRGRTRVRRRLRPRAWRIPRRSRRPARRVHRCRSSRRRRRSEARRRHPNHSILRRPTGSDGPSASVDFRRSVINHLRAASGLEQWDVRQRRRLV